MKKRVISLLLTAGMVMGVRTGCGQETQNVQDSSEKQDSSVAESESEQKVPEDEPEEEIVTVKWCMRTEAQTAFKAMNPSPGATTVP